MKSETQYYNDISILRVSAMLMVVFYHCLCPYTTIWEGSPYGVGFQVPIWQSIDMMLGQLHLPIFFLISGFLYGCKRIRGGYSDFRQFVRGKVKRVLLPYVMVGLFLCLLQHRGVDQMLYGVSHLWFLVVIFECYLFGRLLDFVLLMGKKQSKMLIAVTICFIVFVSYRLPGNRILCEPLFVKYFPLYMIGMLLSKVNFGRLAMLHGRILLYMFIALAVFVMQQLFLRRSILDQMTAVSVIVLLFVSLRTMKIKSLPSSIRSLDKCSMGIYIVHHIVIQEMNGTACFHHLASTHCYLYPIIQFVMLTLLSWGFVALCDKSKYSKYVLG